MSQWASAKARKVLAALLRIGWTIKRKSRGSHRILSRSRRDRTENARSYCETNWINTGRSLGIICRTVRRSMLDLLWYKQKRAASLQVGRLTRIRQGWGAHAARVLVPAFSPKQSSISPRRTTKLTEIF